MIFYEIYIQQVPQLCLSQKCNDSLIKAEFPRIFTRSHHAQFRQMHTLHSTKAYVSVDPCSTRFRGQLENDVITIDQTKFFPCTPIDQRLFVRQSTYLWNTSMAQLFTIGIIIGLVFQYVESVVQITGEQIFSFHPFLFSFRQQFSRHVSCRARPPAWPFILLGLH